MRRTMNRCELLRFSVSRDESGLFDHGAGVKALTNACSTRQLHMAGVKSVCVTVTFETRVVRY